MRQVQHQKSFCQGLAVLSFFVFNSLPNNMTTEGGPRPHPLPVRPFQFFYCFFSPSVPLPLVGKHLDFGSVTNKNVILVQVHRDCLRASSDVLRCWLTVRGGPGMGSVPFARQLWSSLSSRTPLVFSNNAICSAGVPTQSSRKFT